MTTVSDHQCVFAAIHDGSMKAGFVQSWANGVYAEHFPVTLWIPNGPYIDAGRNMMAFEFLTNEHALPYEKLLTVDTDIVFTTDQVTQLWELCTEDRPIVSGVYAGNTETGTVPLVYRLAADCPDPTAQASKGMFDPFPVDEVQPGNGVVEAQATGLGFTMYHRSFLIEAFARWAEEGGPWAEMFIPSEIEMPDRTLKIGMHLGEDLSFGVRLWSIGRTISVATDIHLTHLKVMGVRADEGRVQMSAS